MWSIPLYISFIIFNLFHVFISFFSFLYFILFFIFANSQILKFSFTISFLSSSSSSSSLLLTPSSSSPSSSSLLILYSRFRLFNSNLRQPSNVIMRPPSPTLNDYSPHEGSLETLHSSSSSSTMFSCTDVPSLASTSSSSHSKKYPSLDDILANDSPYPYNLSAFISFLSQNHCLETVEFTMDMAKYQTAFLNSETPKDTLIRMWSTIVDTYIRPDSPKELNLSCEVKSKLAALTRQADSGIPPDPAHLQDTVVMVKEMIKENAYLPFITSVRCAQALPQPVAAAAPRRNSAQPRPDSCLHKLDVPASMCSSLPAASVMFDASVSETNWHQPVSWLNCAAHQTSASTGSATSHTSLSKSSSLESLFAGDEQLALGNSDPMTPPESPTAFDYSKHSATTTTTTTKSAAKETPTRTHSHWRKMSKRLKWKRAD